MTFLPANLASFAALALDSMLYCLAEGVLLAALLSLAMRFFPPKNSRIRFAVWLAALIAVAVLPLLGAAGMAVGHARGLSHDAHSVLTIPAAWAETILVIWGAMAILGLLRVAAGWRHIRRLRRSCVAISPELLSPQLQSAIADLRRSRPVSILVSPGANVPAAVGFFKPIVVIPAWLAEESAAGELEYVLRHELAHLRRWDDWTNLLEQIVKAVLFFHPGIWWIERKLTLDREMACDEAVLSEIPQPRLYAECLARVAEKSFLRRQLALAQAAVHRMKHLSRRIARILSLGSNAQQGRVRGTSLWKPAVATVAAAGALSVAWTAQAPVLVRLADRPQVRNEAAAGSPAAVATASGVEKLNRQSDKTPANTKLHQSLMVPALYQPKQMEPAAAPSHVQKRVAPPHRLIQARYVTPEAVPAAPGETLITVVETRYVTGGQSAGALWQISVVEVRWVVPANHTKKEVPRKT